MARNVRTLTFELFGRDRTASKSLKGVGDQAGKTAEVMRRAGQAMAAGVAVAGAAAVAFGIQSVKAFAEAQEAQNRLQFALDKFPALADTNIDALNRLNAALMRKTRFDDDAIASGQAVLAQFGLTGAQLKRLTPLLLDYAGATGKDLATAAEDLGRALLGQGRALKEIGVDFKDTGTLAGNLDQLVQDLSASVGGFAEKDAETAAGKLDQLRNRFGEVQEAIGGALMPALDRMIEWMDGEGIKALERFAGWFAEDGMDALTGFIDTISKMSKDGTLVPTITAGLFAITSAQWALNAAMLANPAGLVVAGIALIGAAIAGLVAWFNWLFNNLETAQRWMYNAADSTLIFLGGVANGFVSLTEGAINAIGSIINAIYEPMNSLLRLLNMPEIRVPRLVIDRSGINRIVNQSIGNIAANNGSGFGSVGGGGMGFRAMAEGGIVRATPGGIPAIVGEGQYDEAVVPLSPRMRGMFGGGDTYNVTIRGIVAGSRTEMAKEVVRAIEDAKKLGDIPRSALT